jgi:hypothetical protein
MDQWHLLDATSEEWRYGHRHSLETLGLVRRTGHYLIGDPPYCALQTTLSGCTTRSNTEAFTTKLKMSASSKVRNHCWFRLSSDQHRDGMTAYEETNETVFNRIEILVYTTHIKSR